MSESTGRRKIVWVGSSEKDLRKLPRSVQSVMGIESSRDLRELDKAMKKTKVDNTSITPSSGNVFADIGFPNPDEMLVKADLVAAILHEIDEHRYTQKQAAEITGLSQSDISNISRCKVERFSQERLIGVLRRFGLDVEISIRKSDWATGTVKVRQRVEPTRATA